MPDVHIAGSVDRTAKAHDSLVVGFDGSDESLAAVRLALALTDDRGRVHVVQTVDLTGDWVGAPALEGRLGSRRREVERAMAALDHRERLFLRVASGDPATEMASLADKVDADAIVLGSSGKGRLRAALGSVGRNVLAAVTRTVLVVPPLAASGVGDRPRRIAVAIKPNTEHGHVLRAACELVPADGELVVVAADGFATGDASAVPADERLASAEQVAASAVELARSFGVEALTVVRRGAAADVLEAVVAEFGVELVVFGRSSRGKLVEPLLGSAPTDFIRTGTVPVAVVSNPHDSLR